MLCKYYDRAVTSEHSQLVRVRRALRSERESTGASPLEVNRPPLGGGADDDDAFVDAATDVAAAVHGKAGRPGSGKWRAKWRSAAARTLGRFASSGSGSDNSPARPGSPAARAVKFLSRFAGGGSNRNMAPARSPPPIPEREEPPPAGNGGGGGGGGGGADGDIAAPPGVRKKSTDKGKPNGNGSGSALAQV